jgi:hypothetical protein
MAAVSAAAKRIILARVGYTLTGQRIGDAGIAIINVSVAAYNVLMRGKRYRNVNHGEPV